MAYGRILLQLIWLKNYEILFIFLELVIIYSVISTISTKTFLVQTKEKEKLSAVGNEDNTDDYMELDPKKDSNKK